MAQLSPVFAALGDATRFAIVERLLREGELSAGAPSVSRHLKVLGEAGVVARRVDAQSRIYSVRPEAIERLCAWAMSHREFWETSLLRLERALLQHGDGRIWEHTGTACSGASCPGWRMLDNNPRTAEIAASGATLLQRHRDGRIWRWSGQACSGQSCPV